MSIITRDVHGCLNDSFDLIIVGGGVYGIMLALESGFRGKRALLLEQNDFASATSYNHLRTLHGGLRYLQTLDLPRFFESVRERQWFLIHFPQLVEILPCVMPLYNKGIRRKSVFRLALWINNRLSTNRNISVIPKNKLPDGSILSKELTEKTVPEVNMNGLAGSALWYDGIVMEPERLLMEILRWSCSMEASALNYVRADGLKTKKGHVIGIEAVDRISGNRLEFRAPVVINAAGPWNREVAKKFDKDYPILFPTYLLLWNLLFNKKALSDYSLAVTPQQGTGHMYFFHNWKGRMLVGTGQEPVKDLRKNNFPTNENLKSFIHDLNLSIPSLSLKEDDIAHVYYGLLPADAHNNLTKREVVLNHERNGGPKGLYSISGIKFTTSRSVAEKILDVIFSETRHRKDRQPMPPREANSKRGTFSFDWMPSSNDDGWKKILHRIINEESVIHLDDLIYRRTSLGENKMRLPLIIPKIRDLFQFDSPLWEEEVKRVYKQSQRNE